MIGGDSDGLAPPSVRWSTTLDAVDGLAADDQRVYVASPEELSTLRLSDGSVEWSAEIPDTGGWVVVTASAGTVSVLLNSGVLMSFDSETGEETGAEAADPPSARQVQNAFRLDLNAVEALQFLDIASDEIAHAVVHRGRVVVVSDFGLRVFGLVPGEPELTHPIRSEVMCAPSAILRAETAAVVGLADGQVVLVDL